MKVWVWLGNVDDTFDLYDYMENRYVDDDSTSQFRSDFNLPWFDDDFREAIQGEPKLVGELLEGASYWEDFIGAVETKVAALFGDESTFNAAVLIYDEDFSPKKFTKKAGGLEFIGSFEF